MSKEKIIIIGGATASGKSDFALKLAHALDTEIISADSMQIYRDMNIGTAKVTPAETEGIVHHMIDIIDPTENFSVSNYVDMVRPIITRLNNTGKIPIIVGGTGLYIDALIYDFDFNNADVDWEYRHHLEDIAREEGNEKLHAMLSDVDPQEAQKIHPNNVKRVIRALEICRDGNTKNENKKTFRYDVLMYILNQDRQLLYDRINRRVDVMMDKGLEKELISLLDNGLSFDYQSMQAIGYKEWKGFFDGELNKDDVTALIKKNSRNYAKRQITWFMNKYKSFAHLVDTNDVDKAISEAKAF